ncbi:MAG: FAD-dependent oxidoreductase, partial [Hyphomonadaceae bacterium]
MKEIKADLAVIGAGSAGLSAASGAAQLGLKVVLFEKGEMGGDCLNTGCVPSKALLAAANEKLPWADAQARVRAAIAAIAPHDSQERFEGLGCVVVREAARFVDARTLESPSVRVRAQRIVVATGSHAAVPPIPGFSDIPFLTNETVFSLNELPKKLIVLGCGAIGAELGQAFRRLGAEVTIIEPARTLAAFAPDLAAPVLAQLAADGIELLEGWSATKIEAAPVGGVSVTVAKDSHVRTIEGSHLLLAAGRKLALDGLAL